MKDRTQKIIIGLGVVALIVMAICFYSSIQPNKNTQVPTNNNYNINGDGNAINGNVINNQPIKTITVTDKEVDNKISGGNGSSSGTIGG